MGQNRQKRSEIICRCNSVSRETIEKAIVDGCDTLNKIFDETTAGVGACGGSCRRKLRPLLEYYLKTKTFPEKIIEDPRVLENENVTDESVQKTEILVGVASPDTGLPVRKSPNKI